MAQALDARTLITDDWQFHASIYTDKKVFESEMEKIFGSSWVYLAHETEIPAGGDYVTRQVGLQPVIVTRGADDGQIHAMFNRCRHRGAQVCQLPKGNGNYFRCAYHGWTYSNSGDLTGVSFSQGYGEDFSREGLGLSKLAHVESYEGFIFGSLADDAPPLTEHLGIAGEYLSRIAGLGSEGVELTAGVQKNRIPANWKHQLENTADPYHFTFVHKSYQKILERRTGKKDTYAKNQLRNPTWEGLDLGGGHGCHQYGDGHSLGIGDLPFNITIFPNLAFVGHQVRVIQPISPMETDVYLYPMMLKGASVEENAERLRAHENFFGPAGFGQPDDLEVAFDRVKRGLDAKANEWLVMSRGIEREKVDERGIRRGGSTDEVPIRAIYRQWKKLMTE